MDSFKDDNIVKSLTIKMIAKCIFPTLLLIIGLRAKSQDEVRTLKFPIVGWSLQVPGNATFLQNAQIDSLENATNRKIDPDRKTFDPEQVHALLAWVDSSFNSFSAQLTPWDPTLHISFQSFFDTIRQSLIQIIATQKGRVVLQDTLSFRDFIGGLSFEAINFQTYYPDKGTTMRTTMYCALVRGYVLTVSIASTKGDVAARWKEAFRRSKFEP
jgi:hypothetical protein